jgi:hypothetical protein
MTNKRQFWLAMVALVFAVGVGCIGAATFVQYEFAHSHFDLLEFRPSRDVPATTPEQSRSTMRSPRLTM